MGQNRVEDQEVRPAAGPELEFNLPGFTLAPSPSSSSLGPLKDKSHSFQAEASSLYGFNTPFLPRGESRQTPPPGPTIWIGPLTSFSGTLWEQPRAGGDGRGRERCSQLPRGRMSSTGTTNGADPALPGHPSV